MCLHWNSIPVLHLHTNLPISNLTFNFNLICHSHLLMYNGEAILYFIPDIITLHFLFYLITFISLNNEAKEVYQGRWMNHLKQFGEWSCFMVLQQQNVIWPQTSWAIYPLDKTIYTLQQENYPWNLHFAHIKFAIFKFHFLVHFWEICPWQFI